MKVEDSNILEMGEGDFCITTDGECIGYIDHNPRRGELFNGHIYNGVRWEKNDN